MKTPMDPKSLRSPQEPLTLSEVPPPLPSWENLLAARKRPIPAILVRTRSHWIFSDRETGQILLVVRHHLRVNPYTLEVLNGLD